MAIIRYHSVQLEEKCSCKQSIKSELQGMLKHIDGKTPWRRFLRPVWNFLCLPYRPTSLPLLPADATARLIQLFFFTMAQQPLVGQGVLIDQDSRSHSSTPHSEGRVTIATQRPLTTHSTQQTDIHASGGIRTHNPNKQAAADPRLRPCGGRVRHPTF